MSEVVNLAQEREARRIARREGVPLPFAFEAEQATLGQILIGDPCSDVLGKVPQLTMAEFFDDAHRLIFAAMRDRDAVVSTWDVVTISDILRATGKLAAIGGPSYLAELMNKPERGNIVEHARILLSYSKRRRVIATGLTIAAEGRLESPFADPHAYQDNLDAGRDPWEAWAESCVKRIEDATRSTFAIDGPRLVGAEIRGIVEGAYARSRRVEETGPELPGMPTGIDPIDAFTQGLRCKGEYTLICAKPGRGKTSLMLQMAGHVASLGVRIGEASRWRSALILSLEMPREELVSRIACNRGAVDLTRIEKGIASGEDLARFAVTCEDLAQFSLYVDDAKQLGPATFKSKVRAWIAECDKTDVEPSFVGIDYFQLMRDRTVADRKGNRQEELNACAWAVKELSDELAKAGRRIAFVMGAQLTDEGKVKYCDAANEHAASKWVITHDKPRNHTPGAPIVAQIAVEKARYGQEGNVALWFHPSITRFSDSDRV